MIELTKAEETFIINERKRQAAKAERERRERELSVLRRVALAGTPRRGTAADTIRHTACTTAIALYACVSTARAHFPFLTT